MRFNYIDTLWILTVSESRDLIVAKFRAASSFIFDPSILSAVKYLVQVSGDFPSAEDKEMGQVEKNHIGARCRSGSGSQRCIGGLHANLRRWSSRV